TKYYLEKLKKDNKCLITINDKALQTAKIVDEKLEKNIPLSVLEGIPYILKDNIITKGLKTTCASKILKDYIPRFDSFVNKIITKQNGILLGKANLDEFAMGSTCENSSFFITPNPLNPKNICGGSSGGCAYALAKDYCVFALGSDTGGSARLPAALCNVYGFKPTYGTISRYGLAEYASSFDQIAPMAKCQEDCLTVFLQISKKDINDETCVGYKTKIINQKSFKIAIPKNYKKYCEKQVVDSFQKKVDALKTVENIFINYIDFDYFDEMLKTYYIVSFAQSYSNLSRYKSFLKDKQKNIYYDFNGEYLNDREIGFGSEVKQRIKNGSEILNK
ncbi:MAG: amidase family protein, partial [Oscillospiraceae bacterium]